MACSSPQLQSCQLQPLAKGLPVKMVPAMKLMLVVSGCEPTKNFAAVLTAGSGAGQNMQHHEARRSKYMPALL